VFPFLVDEADRLAYRRALDKGLSVGAASVSNG
jgi:hypothetical protein